MVSVLEREMYTEAEAARLLRVSQSTLHYWLDGGEQRGKTHKPVIRLHATGKRSVTWAEFVEAGLLREYRQTHRVPMAEVRAFVDLLRDKFGVPYPLADRRPFVSGRQLVFEAQEQLGLDPEYCLVTPMSGQMMLTVPSEQFFQRVDWEGDVAAGWRPAADTDSPVRIAPTMRFGRPAIKGISTESVWEQVEEGVDLDEVAETFQLTVADVRWALAYENATRAA